MRSVAVENVQVTKPANKPTARKTAKKTATRKPAATKSTATKVAAKKPVVRTKAVRPLGAVTTTRVPVTPKAAKKAPAKKAAPKVRVAARQATPVVAAAIPAQRTPSAPAKRPLIALVRRTDARPVSYGERLAALMHKKFEHVGPVCHRCLHNASQLATVRAAGAVVAV